MSVNPVGLFIVCFLLAQGQTSLQLSSTAAGLTELVAQYLDDNESPTS